MFPANPVPAARCSADSACIFPPIRNGLCRVHLRDRDAERSPVGGCAAQLLGFAPTFDQPSIRVVAERKARCRKYPTLEEIQARDERRLARQRAYYLLHRQPKLEQSRLCVQCGHEFQTRSSIAKFCTSQCRYQRNHPPVAKKSKPPRPCRSTRPHKCRTLDRSKPEPLQVLSTMEVLAKIVAHFSNTEQNSIPANKSPEEAT
jgi:hypothetical protein